MSQVLLIILVLWRAHLFRHPPPFRPSAFVRVRDIHQTVHFAFNTDLAGSVLCGYHERHPFEKISSLAYPGEQLTGEFCLQCLEVLRSAVVPSRGKARRIG
jgi:hypothetical protein